MAKDEITTKIDTFIAEHNPISEECQTVYLMVEIRKILDHIGDNKNNGAFTLLRFYCDWTLHTEKTHITKSMKMVMDEIFTDVAQHISKPYARRDKSHVVEFLYMDNLRTEMKNLFEKYNINLSVVKDGWVSFVQYFVKVLENQPIKNPNNNILLFSFLPAAERCVYGIIRFKQPIKGYDHYNFGNVY